MRTLLRALPAIAARVCTLVCLLAAVFLLSPLALAQGKITVDLSKPGPVVSPNLYGIFLEEIDHAGEGGLYGELVKNRSFGFADIPPACRLENGVIVPPRTPDFWTDPKPSDWTMPWNDAGPYPGWSLQAPNDASASMRVVSDHPLNQVNPHSMEIDVDRGGASVVNSGYWGMNFKAGHKYALRCHFQIDPSYKGTLVASLLDENGKPLATHEFRNLRAGSYQLLTAELTAAASDPRGTLALTLDSPGKVWLAYVSLFPKDTFMNRPNGMRKDIAEMIAALKPAFIRFPGGCFTEGISIEDRPQWQQTIGPVEERTPTYSPWGYWTTNGLGFLEWLEFCEDVHAEPLYVFNAGISCAFRSGTFLANDQVPALIQNTLDALEFANGSVTSKWGSLRAKYGHPNPFHLRYVEIGNEDSGPRYGERVAMFYRAIKPKYPSVQVILSSWISGIDRPAIEAAGKVDIVDQHAYTPAGWAIMNSDYFGRYRRDAAYDLYVGEFACNGGVGTGDWLATLNDAAYMMDVERNADVVKMCSYAPLLENSDAIRSWDVNLIHFDSSHVFGRASYYACKMFADNQPDRDVGITIDRPSDNRGGISGRIGLGTYATSAEYRDLTVTEQGSPTYSSHFDNAADWTPRNGEWGAQDGAYGERGQITPAEQWSFLNRDFKQTGIEVKARKLSGDEGFLISLGDLGGHRVQVNIGGWGNTLAAAQVDSGSPMGRRRFRVKTGDWYDLKIETKGSEVLASVNGTLLVDTILPDLDPVIAVAGVDARAHQLIVKVLNAGPDARTIHLDIQGGDTASGDSESITLAAPKLSDENSFARPAAIVPKVARFSAHGTSFDYVFPPYSLVFLRLPESHAPYPAPNIQKQVAKK